MKTRIFRIVAGLLVVIAVQVAGSAAAASASGASTSATRVKVRIHLKGTLRQGLMLGKGRFTLSGVTSSAIADRGTFLDRHLGTELGLPRTAYVRSLRGTKGTIWVAADRYLGNWIVIKGIGAYAGLRGIGHQRGVYGSKHRDGPTQPGPIDVTMTGLFRGR